MKITIAAVGKLKPASPYYPIIQTLVKRIPWDISFKEVEEKKDLPPLLLKEKEAALLLNAIPKEAKIILLDEKGKGLDSTSFSRQLSNWQDNGDTALAFMIGGAAGHGDVLRDKATLSISLGSMTWPHMLARVMLVEQIYRASTIISGHPYHKE